MRAIRYERLGGPEVMEVVDLPRPSPAAGEVVVEVEAAGVNFSDLGRRRDRDPLRRVRGVLHHLGESGRAHRRSAGRVVGRGRSGPVSGHARPALRDGGFGIPTPIVGLELPLEKAAEAHAAMEARTTIEKIVLTVDKKRTTVKKEPR